VYTAVPSMSRYVVIGAGIHGLSTAWHLAVLLRERAEPGEVLVLDKTAIGAGASGIACGVIRNNYFQPAMRKLMAHSVAVWESDPAAFAYHPVGYLQLGHAAMDADIASIHAQQQEIGYASTLVQGAGSSDAYLRELFGDWRAQGITSVLHEHRGGYANNVTALHGLAAKAEAAGVVIRTGVKVTGLGQAGGAVQTVHTDHGDIACEQLVVAAGPWTRDVWSMLGLPDRIGIRDAAGDLHEDQPMWTYWLVQEATLEVDPASFTDSAGQAPPVVHIDTDAPLYDAEGQLVTDEPWGIYYKPDPHFGGIQGGGIPRRIGGPAAEVAVDPYGPEKSAYVVDEEFRRYWTAGLAHCHERFADAAGLLSRQPSGGIGCFTPDSFPVFDRFRQNAYVIADSNHGYKMIGVGELVARELLGQPQELLEPFRFARYELGRQHPTSNSPFPWS